MGSAGMIENAVAMLQTRRGEDFRELFRSDHWLKLGLRAFEMRLENGERDALRAWLECVEAVHGPENRAVLILLGRYGLTDETDLARKLEMAAAADSADGAMAYRLAKQLVREHVLSDPVERRRAMQEIFGVMDVTAESRDAAPASGPATNGHLLDSGGSTTKNPTNGASRKSRVAPHNGGEVAP